MTEVRLLYVTTKDLEQARSIAEKLLELELIACANIIPHMQSIYRWQGAIQIDPESILVLKTEERHVAEVTAQILALHTYETPCVLSLKVDSGAAGYIDWLNAQLK